MQQKDHTYDLPLISRALKRLLQPGRENTSGRDNVAALRYYCKFASVRYTDARQPRTKPSLFYQRYGSGGQCEGRVANLV